MEIPVFEIHKAFCLSKDTLIDLVQLASVLFKHC